MLVDEAGLVARAASAALSLLALAWERFERAPWYQIGLLGIAGSLFATYAGKLLGLYQPGEPAGFIGALIGAIVLLYIAGAIKAKQG